VRGGAGAGGASGATSVTPSSPGSPLHPALSSPAREGKQVTYHAPQSRVSFESFESAVRPLVAAAGGILRPSKPPHASNPNLSNIEPGGEAKEAPAANGGLFLAAHAVAHHRSSTTEGKAAAAAAEAEAEDKEMKKADGADPSPPPPPPPPPPSQPASQPQSPQAGKQVDNTNSNKRVAFSSVFKQFASLASRAASSLANKVTKSSAKRLTFGALSGGGRQSQSQSQSQSSRMGASASNGAGDNSAPAALPPRANAYRTEAVHEGEGAAAGGTAGAAGASEAAGKESGVHVNGLGEDVASSAAPPSPAKVKKSSKLLWLWKKLPKPPWGR
jgi:hypothetical protein